MRDCVLYCVLGSQLLIMLFTVGKQRDNTESHTWTKYDSIVYQACDDQILNKKMLLEEIFCEVSGRDPPCL